MASASLGSISRPVGRHDVVFRKVVFLFQSIIAGAMVLYGTIDSLIDFFSFTAWIFYGGSMVALIVMRYTKPNYPRPYKVIKPMTTTKFPVRN